MENKKKELWDLTKDSLHVKFWNWLWNIDTVATYKTACPYYWQYAGAMLILPLILLVKFLIWCWKPIDAWIELRHEKMAKEYVAKLLQQIKEADTDEKRYKLFKSKCWSKYRWEIAIEDYDDVLMNEVSDGYRRFRDMLSKRKKITQQKIDRFRYGSGGTILSYILGLGILSLLGLGVYKILHSFTMAEFIGFLQFTGVMLSVIAIFWGIIAIAKSLIRNYWCDSWIYKIVFWKYIGMFFVMIWTGIRMFFAMIHSIYTKSCPTINWK